MWILLASLLALAAAWDVRTRRIPNGLTLAGLAAGFLWHGVRGGGPGLLLSGEGVGVAALAFLPYAVRGLGAGDVKLLGAVGALAGPAFMLWTLLGAALAGGPLALAWLAQPRVVAPAEPARKAGMPLAPAIAVGALLPTSRCTGFKSMTRRRRRGAVLVEFALVSALLCLLLFGIIEMGLLFQDQAEVSQAAREAARSAAIGDPTATAKGHAISAGVGLSLTAAGATLETSADGGTTWAVLGDSGTANSAATGSLIRATVTYAHPLVTSYVFAGGSKTLTSKMVMRRE